MLTLLRPHLLALKNRWFGPNRTKHHRHRDLLLGLVALLLMACIFTILSSALLQFQNDPLLLTLVPTKILELIAYVFFILLLLSNTIAALGRVFASESIAIPLSAPVTPLRLYAAKIVEICGETTTMLIVFALPTGLAYAVCLDLPISFLGVGAFLLVPFSLITAGLGVTFATIFVRLVAILWRRGTFLLFGLAVAAIWVLAELKSFISEIPIEPDNMRALAKMIGLFDNPNPPWLPSRWVADILSLYLGASLEALELKLGLLGAATFGSLALGYLTFDMGFLTARDAFGSLRHRRRQPRESDAHDIVRVLLELAYSALPLRQQTRAVILKDLTSLIRDHSQALQLTLYLGIAALYVVILRFLTGAMTFAPIVLKVWLTTLASMNILITGFVITTMMTRLVYPTVSLEGRAFWILQITPIDLHDWLRAKFVCWFPIVSCLSLALLLSGAFALRLPVAGIISSAVIGICFSFGCTGLAIGIGSVFANFDSESPSQISVSLGTLVLLLAGIVFVLTLSLPAAFITACTMLPELVNRIGPLVAWSSASLALGMIIFISLITASWARQLGARSLLARNAS